MNRPCTRLDNTLRHAPASTLLLVSLLWPTFAIAANTPEDGYRAYYQALRVAQNYGDLARYIPERMPRLRAESLDKLAKERNLSKAERDGLDQNSIDLQRSKALKHDIVAVKVERTIPAAGQRPEMALLEVELRNSGSGDKSMTYPVMEKEKGTWKFAGERFPAKPAGTIPTPTAGKPAPTAPRPATTLKAP